MKYKRGISLELKSQQLITVPKGEIWKVQLFGGYVTLFRNDRDGIRVYPTVHITNSSSGYASGGAYIFPEGATVCANHTDTSNKPVPIALIGIAFTAD